MFKLGKENIDKVYLGKSPVQKMYLGKTLIFPNEEAAECYAITPSIAQYDGDYPWVWVEDVQKWYRLNNYDEYEEYGIYGDSIGPFYVEKDLQEATFAAQAYYVTNKNASGNTRIVIDFTTPDEFASGTQFLCGTRPNTTATSATNMGYNQYGVIRIDAGSYSSVTNTYTLETGTRYILDYRTYGTTLRWIVSDAEGNVLKDTTTTFSGSQTSNYPFCINTMNQAGNPLAPYSREGSKTRSVKFYSITSVNDEGTLTNDYEFYDDKCIDVVNKTEATKSGEVTFNPTGEKIEVPSGNSAYKGKLSIVDGKEYEWDGDKWVEITGLTTYETCTAIFDGNNYFTSDATVGTMRKYSVIFKPNYDITGNMALIGNVGASQNYNRQSYYFESGNKITSAVGNKYSNIASSTVFKNNTWSKIESTSVYRSSTATTFNATYYTGATYNGAFTSASTVTNTSGNVIDNQLQYIGIGKVVEGTAPPYKGEMHSVKIDYDSALSTSANWKPYHNYVFVEVDGEIKMYDTVTDTLYSQEGDGAITKGTTYGTITNYKQYEPREAPENPMIFDSIEEMEAYECVFEKMKAIVDGVEYTYVDGIWVEGYCDPIICKDHLTGSSGRQYYNVPQGETAITDCYYNLTGLKTWTARSGDYTSFGGAAPAFNVALVTNNYGTVYDTLEEIDITLPNTLTTFTAGFYGGEKLTKLKRITFRNFGVVTKMSGKGGDNFNIPCLEYLYVDTYNTSTFDNSGGLVVASQKALTDFYVDRITDSGNRSFTAPNLTYDSLMRIINALDSTTNSRTLTLGTTNLAKLTEEDIAIATNKGWIIQ